MHRPEEAYEESQSRTERCVVCENYYTRGDIASKISKGEPVICFYCYEESQSRSESTNASKEITKSHHYIVEKDGKQIGSGYIDYHQAVSIKTHYENVLYCDNIVIKDIKEMKKMLTFNEEIKMDYKMHGVRPTMRLSLKASIQMVEPKLSKKRITKIAEMVMDTMYIKMDDRELPIVPPFIHPSI